MEALKLAFETVIVGVLALPWMAFVLDLLFRPKNHDKDQVWSLRSFLKREMYKLGMEIPSAVGGVVLFVAAYFVGVVVTRASGDFFNDRMPKVVPTEDHIRRAAYCYLADTVESEGGTSELSKRALGATGSSKKTSEVNTNEVNLTECGNSKESEEAIQRLFRLREGALLLQGGDKTDRLNQLHSQILVLRGAAFNGFLTFMLCLFGLGSNAKGRLVWWVIPLATAGIGIVSLFLHAHGLADPPYMEFILMLLGLTGRMRVVEPFAGKVWRRLSALVSGIPHLVLGMVVVGTALRSTSFLLFFCAKREFAASSKVDRTNVSFRQACVTPGSAPC